MAKFVEQFAAQLTSADSQILVDLLDFVDWRTQAQGTTFAPHEVDDVAIRSYLLLLKLSGASRSILGRTIASLKHFYDWVRTNHLIAKSPVDSFDFNRPLLAASRSSDVRKRASLIQRIVKSLISGH